MAATKPRLALMIPIRKSIGGLGNLMFKQAYIYAQFRRDEIPDVYVQSQKYWTDFAEEIKQMFGDVDEQTDMVSLHIRRGDYLDTDFYVDLTKTDYYKKATNMFPDDRFLVFYKDRQDDEQDYQDRKWCREYLDEIIPGRYEIWQDIDNPLVVDRAPDGDETADLNKMASCKSNILSNSSFSWWAAFLNPNLRKKVVVPEVWFTDGIQRIDLLEEWIKI